MYYCCSAFTVAARLLSHACILHHTKFQSKKRKRKKIWQSAFCIGVSVLFALALFTEPSTPATHIVEQREYMQSYQAGQKEACMHEASSNQQKLASSASLKPIDPIRFRMLDQPTERKENKGLEDTMNDAQTKFEAEFGFSKMDTMMHRFPPALRDEMNKLRYPYMVVPRFVAIGPYHHGEKHLEKMEEVKHAAAAYLCERIEVDPAEAMKKVLDVGREARGKYYLDLGGETAVDDVDGNAAGTLMKDDAYFAAMMFRDACFLLLYMEVYDRSHGEEEDYVVKPSMRRFLFSNRDAIESDVMLLENQIPWRVIQVLVDLAKENLSQAVGKFITGMGNSFKITESCDDDPSQKNKEFCGFFKSKEESCHDPPATYDKLNDENNPPAHLLEALRRHKTESKPVSSTNTHTICICLQPEKKEKTPAVTKRTKPAVTSISWMSAVNLEEIGIKLKVIPTATFSEMHLEKGLLLNRRLTLAPLLLSDNAASCLVNMAALEVCTQSRFGDDGDKNAVCSYLAVLAFLMVGTKDVCKLRSMGLLHGMQSDGDMLTFFNAVAKHLPIGRNFAFLMGEIQEYKEKRPIRTTLYKWFYNHSVTIIKVVSLIATVIGIFATVIALYKALSSAIHKN